MPRAARPILPGSVHHLISRFINRAYRLTTPAERAAYLEGVPSSMAQTDWLPLAFALMSTHVHWAGLAGTEPCWRFVKPLHTRFAGWLNRRQHTLGPVFAARFASVVFPPERAGLLLAYLHNNPVRANLVADPADSPWTSHRAYLGLVAPPPWLNVERGLALCGFDASPSGRLAFHDFVCAQRGEGADDDQGRRGDLARVRAMIGAAVELGDPIIASEAPGAPRYDVVAVPDVQLRPRWPGPVLRVLAGVALERGLETGWYRSPSRSPVIADGRRLALWVWTRHLHRAQCEMSAALGISESAASNLLRRAPTTVALMQEQARRIAAACWQEEANAHSL